MKILNIVIIITLGFLSCKNEIENTQKNFLTKEIPINIPIEFKGDLTYILKSKNQQRSFSQTDVMLKYKKIVRELKND